MLSAIHCPYSPVHLSLGQIEPFNNLQRIIISNCYLHLRSCVRIICIALEYLMFVCLGFMAYQPL